MSYVQPWSDDVPVGTDPANQIATYFNNLEVAISERIIDLFTMGGVSVIGNTTITSGVITGITDTSGFIVGGSATVSTGFPSSSTPYLISAVTSTTITLTTNATSSTTGAVIAQVAGAPSFVSDPLVPVSIPFNRQSSTVPSVVGNVLGFSIRNSTNSADNIKTDDSGNGTVRGNLNVGGNLTVVDVNAAAVTSNFATVGSALSHSPAIQLATQNSVTSPSTGQLWFDGSNLRLSVGGTAYTITKS